MRPTAWSKERSQSPLSHFKLEVDFRFNRLEIGKLRTLLQNIPQVKQVFVEGKTIVVNYKNIDSSDVLCQIKVALYEFACKDPDISITHAKHMTNSELAIHLRSGLRP